MGLSELEKGAHGGHHPRALWACIARAVMLPDAVKVAGGRARPKGSKVGSEGSETVVVAENVDRVSRATLLASSRRRILPTPYALRCGFFGSYDWETYASSSQKLVQKCTSLGAEAKAEGGWSSCGRTQLSSSSSPSSSKLGAQIDLRSLRPSE